MDVSSCNDMPWRFNQKSRNILSNNDYFVIEIFIQMHTVVLVIAYKSRITAASGNLTRRAPPCPPPWQALLKQWVPNK